jgi:hypothetical protein
MSFIMKLLNSAMIQRVLSQIPDSPFGASGMTPDSIFEDSGMTGVNI